jgi:hypothetical protein
VTLLSDELPFLLTQIKARGTPLLIVGASRARTQAGCLADWSCPNRQDRSGKAPKAPLRGARDKGGAPMGRRLIENLLASTEGQIDLEERHVTAQRGFVAQLERARLGSSKTAELARQLLRSMEARLQARVTERRRLQDQLDGRRDHQAVG